MIGGERPVLLVGEAISFAHLGRLLTLASWARKAGHDVHVACGSGFAALAGNDGFTTHELPGVPSSIRHQRMAMGRPAWTEPEFEHGVESELRLLRRIRPRLVVADGRWSAPISASIAGIPSLALIDAHWSPASAASSPAPDSHGLTGIVDRVRRRRGLAELHDLRQHASAGTWCGYLDVPKMTMIERLPPDHFHLGPVLWRPPSGAASESQPDCPRPIARLVLGSSGDSRLLPEVLAALLACGCDIALSGMPAEGVRALRRAVPALVGRLVAVPWHAEGISGRCAPVTICHGAGDGIRRSLAVGAPALCLPETIDERLASQALFRAGAGLVLPREDLSVTTIIAAVRRLLHDRRIQARAQALRAAIAEGGARANWLRFLERGAPPRQRDEAGSGTLLALR
jgi:UDP:flavonoid glycosyltransferase YjiC (YdhE family)